MEFSRKNYEEALKSISKTKEEQFLMVDITYDLKLILPFKKAMEFIASLEEALVYIPSYSKAPNLKSLEKEITFYAISKDQINDIRVAKLLNITREEAEKMRETT